MFEIRKTKKILSEVEKPLYEDPKSLFEDEKHLINKPFFFEGTNGKGVLLVHGWTSTPYEIRRLGKFLNSKGYTVLGILLSGHGTQSIDLEKVSWHDWVDDVERGYQQLKEKCSKVYVGGTSIGATLAMILAQKIAKIDGLILMATPYKMRLERTTKFFAHLFLFFGRKYHKKFYPPSFGSSGIVTRVVSYQVFPIKSVLDAIGATQAARRNVHLISQPVLAMQSTHDHIVTASSLEQIYQKTRSQIKIKRYIDRAYHTFIADINNEHVFDDILDFLEKN